MSFLPSVMPSQKDFSRVPQINIPRSQFNRSHGYKTTFDSGYLIPFFWDEVLPGDTLNLRASVFARLATPLHPYMDNLHMDTFFFFCQSRLLWDNFERMMGQQDDPTDSIDYMVPIMTSPVGGYDNQSLSDYLGIPTKIANMPHISMLHRMYNFVWNTHMRDQNLQDSVVVDKDDGPDNPSDYVLLKRGKRHDYFTSCLPWPQKGTAVGMPLTGNAPVTGIGFSGNTAASASNVTPVRDSASTGLTYPFGLHISGSTGIYFRTTSASTTVAQPMIQANLSGITAVTINEFRQAISLQTGLELFARGGTRYPEIILSSFGVVSDDGRLSRPEYLGGGSEPIKASAIAQTSSTDATSPQGNLAAMAVANFSGHGFTKSFTEHGYVLGLVMVRADLTYQQGLPRMYSRRTRWDYYWPFFAQLGEQAVLNKEIYAQGDSVAPGGVITDNQTFGYQERNAEYRYKPSVVTGKFRSNDAQSLDTWHLAQDFTALPVLNDEFIEENPPVDRILAVEDEPEILFDSYLRYLCARPMPVYGIPATLGRL